MVVAVLPPVRLVTTVILLASSAAAAQPTMTTQPVKRHHGDELAPGAWPGVSLEDLRGMRECSLDDPPTVVGSPVTCRPPVLPSAAHVSFDVAWLTGFSLDGGDVRGLNGLAVDGEYWLTRSLGIGARFAYVGVAAPMGMSTTRLGEATGSLHWRLFTDEVDRDAFMVSVGGGVLGGTRSAAPIARVALSRNIGYMTGEKSSLTFAWEVAGEQTLDADQLRLVTAGVRAGFELGIREPHNLAEPDPDPPFRYAIGGEFRGSAHVGVGGSFVLPLGDSLQWRTIGLWTVGRDSEGTHGLRALWGAVTGPRLLFTPSSVFIPYLDLQGGPAAVGGDTTRLGWLAEAEAGFDLHIGCQTRIDLGGRIQGLADDGIGVRTGFFVLRVEHGRALRHSRGRCDKDVPIAR